ncbi:MAG TPA: hypothetical protein VM163_10180 [bacterium]|nr:hypothetical protein [bacterium]
MTDESQFCPHLVCVCPPKGAADVSGSLIRLDIVDDDYNDELHFGALRADSLAFSVDPGTGRFDVIIKGGIVQSGPAGRRFQAQIMPRIAHTGASLTGRTLTGRFRQRTTIFYLPREFFADGERIGVRVSAADRYGYELDETYYFTMHSWGSLKWPSFSLFTQGGAGPLNVVSFPWYARGAPSEVPLSLIWGKDSSIDLDLDDALLRAESPVTNGQGKELIENGYLLFKKAGDEEWDEVSSDSDIHLGPLVTNSPEQVVLKLAVPEGAVTAGPVVLTLSLTPVRASLTGSRMSGRETTGASRGSLGAMPGADFKFYTHAFIMSPETRDYFESHFIKAQS